MPKQIKFSEIDSAVRNTPGIYEIHTNNGVALKVGIGGDLLKRLKLHRASRDSGLKLSSGGDWGNPAHVTSKSSILAKHLYFDSSITAEYDLKTQAGRQKFLSQRCLLLFDHVPTREEAHLLEVQRESSGLFRYIGEVRIR